MKIKISVLNNRALSDINIQNIKLSNKFGDSQPRIYFDCPKKYEYLFSRGTLVFHGKNGRELFRSKTVRIDFRYYELDTWIRKDKVRFVADLIQFEDIGPVSGYYLSNILEGKKKHKTPCIQDKNTENSGDFKRAMKLLRNIRIENKQWQILRKYRRIFPKYGHVITFIYRELNIKYATYCPDSCAPT